MPVERITLFLFGGVSNIEREPPSAFAEFLTAVVGPLTSVLLGVLLLIMGSFAIRVPADLARDAASELESLSPIQSLLLWLGPINIVVGVFNLIPGFPLDGGRILRAAIWGITGDLHSATRWASAIGQGIGWTFVFIGLAIVFGAHVPFFGSGVVAGLWLAFIGWFLTSAAAQTWRRQLVREVLEGVPVARLMSPPAPLVPAHVDLNTLVSDWMVRGGDRAFPVVEDQGDEGGGEQFLGLVTFADIRKAPRDEWPNLEAAQVMTPRSTLVTTSPREDLADAADKLARVDVSQLPGRGRRRQARRHAAPARSAPLDRAAYPARHAPLRALKNRGAAHLASREAVEGDVRVGQRVHFALGSNGNPGGEFEELPRVFPREVGDAAQSSFPPQIAVGELGDPVEVNGVDGHGAPAIERPQRRHDHAAGRGEGDGGVEALGRRVVVPAGPLGAEAQGARSFGRRSGAHEHAAAPVARHLHGEAGRRAEPVEPEAAPRLDGAHLQRAIADHAPLQSSGGGIESRRSRRGGARRSRRARGRASHSRRPGPTP